MHRIRFGIDRLCADGARQLQGARVGLVTNDTATTACVPRPLAPSRAALRGASANLVALFSPEHGLAAAALDGAHVADARDSLTGLPVRSLYGEHFAPTAEMLADVDAMVFDLPDIGARFYTYIWTLSHLLEGCAAAGKPVWVLDRPNPLGGKLCEGPILDDTVPPSLVGRWPIPVRHGLTVGELARLWVHERAIGVELHTVEVEGWERSMTWPSLGLPFVPTSPAMPSFETALLYPGTCLLEGTNLSEGRGTSAPFRVAGAPWLDGNALSARLNGLGLPGVAFRAVAFTPSASKHAGAACGGVMLHALDEGTLRTVATGLHLVRAVADLHPDQFEFTSYATANNRPGQLHFDRLVGRADIRPAVLEASEAGFAEHVAEWTDPAGWADRVAPWLLYA